MTVLIHSLLLFANLFFTAYTATDVRLCDDGSPLPLFAQINDCKQMPCPVVRGAVVVMDVVFQNLEYTETTAPHAIATGAGVSLNYTLEQKNGCEGFTNIRCPIDPGDRVRYHFEMAVASVYPRIPFELTFSLLDDRNKRIFCFDLDAQVVDS